MSDNTEATVAILQAQLSGARHLIKHLQQELEAVANERDQMAGIGIQCGCGEDSCTVDAESLQEAICKLRLFKLKIDKLRKAGDAVALDYAERIEIEAGETAKTLMSKLPVLREWNEAKESKPNE